MTINQTARVWEDARNSFKKASVEATIESIINSIEKLHKTYKSSDVEDLYVEMKWLEKDKDIDRHIDKCFDLISSIKEFGESTEENLIRSIHYELKVLEGYIEY